ncbi:hypothetical protein [Tessaracoccus massiliensis]|uniref:hypothetical protein n=1 Tax=Tessaracoccus massiliensis TaxID=1522311 RepID=UPI00058E1BDB|nr:hypothetical protein [Tessaracoccus massiliensis]
MNDNFHDLFKASVPEAPSTRGWVEGARRKRRGRQLVTSGTAALAVVALAVPAALNLSGGAEPIVASPEPTASAPAPTPDPTASGATGVDVSLSPNAEGKPGAAACYGEDGEPAGERSHAGTIRTGAARAWLCTNPDNFGTGGPLEPLVVDVDGLVEALYAQPTLTDDSAQAVAEHYTVVFEFDDGRRMSFSGDTRDSTALTDGVNSLQGSAAFYRDEVEAGWLAQRARAGAPATGYESPQECPVLSCQQSLLPVSLDRITGGYACTTDADTSRAVELRQSLAEDIGWAALANAWGAQILLRKAGERYEFRGEDSLMGWTPAPGLATELDALPAG